MTEARVCVWVVGLAESISQAIRTFLQPLGARVEWAYLESEDGGCPG